MMDKGEFVKAPIEINPAANGGYVVRRQGGPYEGLFIAEALAFSNHLDLLNWLMGEYPAAHANAQPSHLPTQEG